VRGVLKHHTNIFTKSPCRKLFKQIDKYFDVRFFFYFFVLSRFQVLLSEESPETLPKTFLQNNRVEKLLQKFRQKNKCRFLLDFVYYVFMHFI
jgi:hypothetical protein